MRIVIFAFGTRGDVQPSIALGLGLKAVGYEVRLVGSQDFAAWVQSYGLDFRPVSVDIQAMMNSNEGREWSSSSDNPLRELQIIRRLFTEYAAPVGEELFKSAADADVIISGFTSYLITAAIADKINKRHIALLLQPLAPTREGHAILNPLVKGSSRLNLLARWLEDRFLWYAFSPASRIVAEKNLHIPPYTFADFRRLAAILPTIYGLSPSVMPRPADWQPHQVVAGYLFLDDVRDWQPPQALQAFLDAGAPPVYIGFGSMSNRNPEQTAAMLVEALQISGQRGIIASGWAGLQAQQLPDSVYLLDAAPHSWLFPRMAGVIHHGGAGTTAAGLRAGMPTMIVPHLGDQPYWGRRVYELGVGTAPLPRHKITAANLAAAVKTLVTDNAIRQRAAALSQRIRAEDGVQTAVRAIGNMLAN